MAALAKRLPQALQDGEPQEVANSLWAWGKLGLPVDGDLAAAASKAVLRTAPAMVPEAVIQVSWAHHRGGWQLSAAAVGAVEARRRQLISTGQGTERST